jgi:hypothetical protein
MTNKVFPNGALVALLIELFDFVYSSGRVVQKVPVNSFSEFGQAEVEGMPK